MKGTVKFFDGTKGWGFITSEEGWEAFVHYSNIVNMEGRKTLDENDIVKFEYGENSFGRDSALNVQPILTTQMMKKSLKDEHLHLKKIGSNSYLVIDENNVIQSPEQGMTFEELASYAGFSVKEE